MKYVYEGPGPQEDPEGGIARPGDVRDFAEEPAWGPWRPLDDPEPPAAGPPAPAVTVTPPVPPATAPAPAAGKEGM